MTQRVASSYRGFGAEHPLQASRLDADVESLLAGEGDLAGRAALLPAHELHLRVADLSARLALGARVVEREVRGVEERLGVELRVLLLLEDDVRAGNAARVEPDVVSAGELEG